jgi:hypothetical protein
VTVDPLNPAKYHVEFPAASFSRYPAVVILPIGNFYVAGLQISRNGDGSWYFDATLSAPTVFEFIATNEAPQH